MAGVLVLPQNYLEISDEEMTYLDGGFAIPNWVVAGGINIGIAAITGGGAVKLLTAFIRRKGSAAAKAALRKVLTRFIATQAANRVSGLVIGAINGFLSWSVGSAVATIWDRNDVRRNNGYCNNLW